MPGYFLFGDSPLEVSNATTQNSLEFNESWIVWLDAGSLLNLVHGLAERGNQFRPNEAKI